MRRRGGQPAKVDTTFMDSTPSDDHSDGSWEDIINISDSESMTPEKVTRRASVIKVHDRSSFYQLRGSVIAKTPTNATNTQPARFDVPSAPRKRGRRESIRPLEDFGLKYHLSVITKETWTLLILLLHGTFQWISKLARLMGFVVALLPAFVVFFLFYVWHSDRIALPYIANKSMRTSRHYLDIYGSSTASNDQLKPVVVFLTGGAWIIGYKMWGTLLARTLVPFGIMVVIPDYRNFPQSNIDGMMEDVDAAVDWTLRNIHKYGGDPNKVVLCGQSAGAHIGACVLLRKAKLEAPSSNSPTTTTSSWHPVHIQGFIGVSGPYDLVAMKDILHGHGLDKSIVSAMFCNDVAQYSPTVMVQQLEEEEKQRVQKYFPPTCIIHGEIDKTVPFEISLAFFEALKHLELEYPLMFKLYPNWSHTDMILEAPFAGNHLFHRDVYDLVKLWTTATNTKDCSGDKSTEGDDPAVSNQLLLPFDESHPACGKICPLFLVQIARRCNPF